MSIVGVILIRVLFLMEVWSHKQKSFVQEFVLDFNATQAAIRPGYSERSAEVTGFRLLRNAKICEEIYKLKETMIAELRQKFIAMLLHVKLC